MRTYFIKTFGCQMNVSDSERIAAALENSGLKPAPNISEAGIVVFNTCGVRQMAEDRVYGQIHNLISEKQAASNKPKIIVTGCLSNRKDVQRRLKDKVDLFIEMKDFPKNMESMMHNLPNINKKSKIHNTSYIINATPKENIDYLSINPKHKNNFEAYVPIMTGCNNFCAYCIVPYARGREISRPEKEIIMEIRNLIKRGYKHIILLGQNVNSYSHEKINFSKLLRKVNSIPGHFWISFISNHPKDVTDEMIETVAQLPKVCEYFHLPVQAGDDRIIRRMNRKYTAKKYLELVKKIRSAFGKYKPGAIYSLTTDVIVGFPGETEEQFFKTAGIMEKVPYDLVYFGQYSPRPGTAAWEMKDNVSKKEKARREKYLNEILKKSSSENNKKYLKKTFEILVESKQGGFFFGKTRTMKRVRFSEKKRDLTGKFVKIKITRANIWNLEGKLAK